MKRNPFRLIFICFLLFAIGLIGGITAKQLTGSDSNSLRHIEESTRLGPPRLLTQRSTEVPLIERSLSADPEEFANLIDRAVAERDYEALSVIFRRWGSLEPTAALDAFQELRLPETWGQVTPHDSIRLALMEGWTMNDPDSLAAWIERQETTPFPFPASLLVKLGESDPNRALSIAARFVPTGQLMENTITPLFHDWIKRDPSTAGQELIEFAVSNEMPELLTPFFRSLTRYADPEVTKAWLVELPVDLLLSGERESLLHDMGNHIGMAEALTLRLGFMEDQVNSEAFSEELNNLLINGNSGTSNSANTVENLSMDFARWVACDPDQAMDWAGSQPDEDIKTLLQSQIPIGFSMNNEFEAVNESLNQIPEASRHLALRTMANSHAHPDGIESALALAKQLTDSTDRDRFLEHLLNAAPIVDSPMYQEALKLISDPQLKEELMIEKIISE